MLDKVGLHFGYKSFFILRRWVIFLFEMTMFLYIQAFHRLTGLSAEESPTLEDMVSCLLPLFEQIHHKHPQLVRSVALAVDLCINFILNLFDP